MTGGTGLKRFMGIVLALTCVALTSCGLLPEEETFAAAPVIREYAREAFRLAAVERGDMELTKKVTCTFMPVQTESLAYEVGGIAHDGVYVAAGDHVEAGQLLASLDTSQLQAQLEDAALRLELARLRRDAAEENRALALKRLRIEGGDEAQVNAAFDWERQAAEDEIYLIGLEMEECQARLAERQLRASFAGTITFVRTPREGDRSVVGEKMVTVADSTLSLFRAKTEYWDRFEPGTSYVITVNRKPCDAVVTSEAELGLPETEKTPGESADVYLRLETPDFEIKDSDYGALYLVLESRHDVLMVPETAVSTAGGQTVVYYQDEEGMKAFKPVEVGLVADRKVEIISGLTEGEIIIAE